MGICCMAKETQTGALYQPRWVDEEGDGREVQREEIYVYLWLIHVDIWQKPTKFCKAIIYQLKHKLKKMGCLDNQIRAERK